MEMAERCSQKGWPMKFSEALLHLCFNKSILHCSVERHIDRKEVLQAVGQLSCSIGDSFLLLSVILVPYVQCYVPYNPEVYSQRRCCWSMIFCR